ncbi:response regulator transcription factor [Nocardioides psychrotolerans]|uniref:response regulator n=1 Tax=Nocardioides psychrotolerans TaxID=1005945 RepID=UPI0031377758
MSIAVSSAARVAPPSRQVRVFLLHHHELIRCGVRSVLDGCDDLALVGEAAVASGATARIAALRPDVVVLDTRMDGGAGVEICRALGVCVPPVATLVLAADDDDTHFAAIDAGATGFLLDQVSAGELAQGIRRVADGLSVLDPAVTGRVLDRLRQGQALPAVRRVAGIAAHG